jgi:hypothetical protein
MRPAIVAAMLSLSVGQATAGTGRLIVKVRDAGTGQDLPARIALRASDDRYPGDRIGLSARDWPGIEAHGVFIDGEGSFELPEGSTSIVAAHGACYDTARAEVDIPAGGTIRAELKLRRILDMRELGWVGGDAHVHMIHGENQRPTGYQDVATACRANGLDWAYVNQEYTGAGKLDLAGYEAQCRQVSSQDFRLFIGGERPKSLLGHHALIGVTDPFVVPDDPPYYRSARAIHAQGGVLFNVHPVRYYPGTKAGGQWLDFPGNNLARELVFDAFLGPSFDGISVLSDEPANAVAHRLWFNLLNRGLFVPALADSDACFDRPVLSRKAPGFWTTYLHIGRGTTVDHANLAEAVRAGRTLATTGPLLLFGIDGQISGSTLSPDGQPHVVEIDVHQAHHNWTLATMDSGRGTPAGIAKVELIRNGVVVKSWEPKVPQAALRWSVAETGPCWYAARAYGTDCLWQVALASPIYFAHRRVTPKREPLTTTVRGRVYDFRTGVEREGDVEVRRGDVVLARFKARGQFRVRMPLDAEIAVCAAGSPPIRKELLLDYAPVHRFLWYLQADDLGRADTFDRLEAIVRQVDLEFPLGYRMSGCDLAAELREDLHFRGVRVLDVPPHSEPGETAVAAILLDKSQVGPGDHINLAAIFHDERDPTGTEGVRLLADGRAYDASRPTGFSPLKTFSRLERDWSDAVDLGRGYRMIAGRLVVPTWARPGPAGEIEIDVLALDGGRDHGHVGLRIPMGPTRRTLALASAWPTMPLSWPDHNYGVGPLRICGKAGRLGQPRSDYRQLHLVVETSAGDFDLWPSRDGRGCPDADDAVFTERFLDQVQDDESHLARREPIRPQPPLIWRDTPVIDATRHTILPTGQLPNMGRAVKRCIPRNSRSIEDHRGSGVSWSDTICNCFRSSDAEVAQGRSHRSTVLRVHATASLHTTRQGATRRPWSPRARGVERDSRRAGCGQVRERGLWFALRCSGGQRARKAKSGAGRVQSTRPGAAVHETTSGRQAHASDPAGSRAA